MGAGIMRNDSLDRLDQDALSLDQHRPIEVTNQSYKNGRNGQMKDALSTADLQAQILIELNKANDLAKNTSKSVKKIANASKPSYVVTPAKGQQQQ